MNENDNETDIEGFNRTPAMPLDSDEVQTPTQ
jgi:hypothetical protein